MYKREIREVQGKETGNVGEREEQRHTMQIKDDKSLKEKWKSQIDDINTGTVQLVTDKKSNVQRKIESNQMSYTQIKTARRRLTRAHFGLTPFCDVTVPTCFYNSAILTC